MVYLIPLLVTPSIIPFSYDEIVNVGDAFNLFCQISKGDKPIVIKWSFRGFDDSHGIQIVTNRILDSSLLSISNATASHSGTYTCIASNNAGSSSYATNITVNGKHGVLTAIRFLNRFIKRKHVTIDCSYHDNKVADFTVENEISHLKKNWECVRFSP